MRELLLHGLLTASGWVVIAAAAGALWQIDLEAWGLSRFLPSTEGVWGGLRRATPTIALEIGVLIVFAVLIFRLLSAVWSAIKHYEFTLTARGDELFQSYGLLTRVGRTIPRSRIQKLTISEAPLMRLLGRATVTVDTAASVSEQHAQQAAQGSHVLVPIVPASRLAALIRDVHPAGAAAAPDLDALDWQGVHPRTFRRLVRMRLVFAALAGAASYGMLHGWAIAVGLAAAAALVLEAWVTARFTAFAWSGDTLCFRSGDGDAARDARPHRPDPGGQPRAIAVRSPLGDGRRPGRHGRRRERRPPRPHPLPRLRRRRRPLRPAATRRRAVAVWRRPALWACGLLCATLGASRRPHARGTLLYGWCGSKTIVSWMRCARSSCSAWSAAGRCEPYWRK